jgi:MoxR-like ATPase
VSDQKSDSALVQQLQESIDAIRGQLAQRIVGQQAVINDLLACFLSGGHCLLVGVPGLAKTMLIQSLSQCLDLQFNRVQFTPDLMPADITGSEILYEDRAAGTREFRFVKGPIFSNILLADEINRTPPKTQSALLQAMQEHEITSSGQTYPLPSPFWVLATQNPIEQEGTYPLPEAQQDRFMFSIEIGYPDLESEVEIVRKTTVPQSARLEAVVSHTALMQYRDLVWRVPVAESVIRYAVQMVRATRPGESDCPETVRPLLTWGAGPRASQYLTLAAKTYALLDGRPTPDESDIRRAAQPVLRHRLVRAFQAEAEGVTTAEIIDRLIEKRR